MESKLMEKKAIIEVLESIMNGTEWVIESKKQDIQRHLQSIETEENETGEKVADDDWRYSAVRGCRAYLDAFETVKKHLEKLI